MTTRDASEVPPVVGRSYRPDREVDDISTEERELCLELLAGSGFRYVAGCVGVGQRQPRTVALLAKQAEHHGISLLNGDGTSMLNDDNSGRFFIGPDPCLDGGVAIWTADDTPQVFAHSADMLDTVENA